MPTFDIEGARKAGISDAEIAAEMSKGVPQFNFTGAKQAGVSDTDIINELSQKASPDSSLISKSPTEPTDPAWAGKFPTGYGVYGAGKETAKAVGEFFGVDKITDPMARIAAHTMAKSNAERAGVGTPSAGELAQSAAYTGALLSPYSKMSLAVGGVASKVLPKAGPYIGKAVAGGLGGYMYDAGSKLAKDEVPTPGAATAIGAILPPGAAVIGKAGKGTYEYLTKKEPARIINSLIKPLLKDFNFAKNPGRVLAEEGMVANSFDDLVSKISQKRPEIGKKLEVVASTLDRMAKGKKAATIDVSAALTPIDDAMEEAAKQNNQALIDRLVKAKNAITKNLALGVDENGAQTIIEVGKKNLTSLGFNDAIGIKREIGSLTKWTDNASDDKTINAALKQTYGSIREIIESKADELHPGLAAQFRKLNEKYADITSAEIAAKYRDKIIERHDLMSLKGHTGLATGTILAAVSTGGAGLPVILAGLGGAALDKALGSTAVKTRVATWLAKAATQDKNILYRKAPKLAAAIDKAFGIKGLQFPGDMIAGQGGRKGYVPPVEGFPRKAAAEEAPSQVSTRLPKSPLTRVGTSVGSMSDEAASGLVSQTRRANAVEAFKNVPPNKVGIDSARVFEEQLPESVFVGSRPIGAAKIVPAKMPSTQELIDRMMSSNVKSAEEAALAFNAPPVFKRSSLFATPSQKETLSFAREDIARGEAGFQFVNQLDEGGVVAGAQNSSFPEWFQNKGYTKKASLNAIDKALKGDPLTKGQQEMVIDINKGYRDKLSRDMMKERTTNKNKFPWETEKRTNPDRRSMDSGRRENIERMIKKGDIEGIHKALYEDPLTGTLNRRAFDEAYPQAIKEGLISVSMDSTGLGYVNKKFGHVEGGNVYLKEMTDALKAEGIELYRMGGDEFAALVKKGDIGRLKAAMHRFSAKTINFKTPEGKLVPYKGGQFNFGVGKDFGTADLHLKQIRDALGAKGKRVGKGEKPPQFNPTEADPLGIR